MIMVNGTKITTIESPEIMEAKKVAITIRT
jgi:hypothetical protein